MGTAGLADLLNPFPLTAEALQGRTLAVDTMNLLYAGLAVYRYENGLPLSHEGRVTAHIIGLVNRVDYYRQHGINAVFVFDGAPIHLKLDEVLRRNAAKEDAQRRYEEAVASGDQVLAQKMARAAMRLTPEMVQDAKSVLDMLGASVVQAPTDGEAQCAQMVRSGRAFAVATQDYDALLFGASTVIRNLAPTRDPELHSLPQVLTSHQITMEQLIDVALLAGTDYNDGVTGIGPKKALGLIKKYGSIEKIIEAHAGDIMKAPATVQHVITEPIAALSQIRAHFSKPMANHDAPPPTRAPSPEAAAILSQTYGIDPAPFTEALRAPQPRRSVLADFASTNAPRSLPA